MPGLEDGLVTAAGGDFGLLLIAFLVFTLVGGFLWAMKKVLDQNQAFNAGVLRGMGEIVQGMKEYKNETCVALDRHDQQAKKILDAVNETSTTLKARPCIQGNGRT